MSTAEREARGSGEGWGGRPAAWVAAAAPVTVPVLLGIHGIEADATGLTAWLLRGLSSAVALGLLAGSMGSVLLHRHPRVARALLAGSAMAFGVLGVLGLADAPLASFVVALAAVALVTVVPERDQAEPERRRRPRARARAAAWAALLVMLGLAAFRPTLDPFARVAGLLPAAVAAFEARMLLRTRGRARMLGLLGAAALGVGALWSLPALAEAAATLVPVGLLLLLPDAPDSGTPLVDLWSAALLGHPARLLLTTFTIMGVTGGVALTMPAASTGAPLTVIDGMFMAFSAVCVTGLAVVDTPVAFTAVGEGIVLLLIQIGGLGILTFTTAAFLAIGNLGVRSEGIAARLLASETPRASLVPALRRVLAVTVVTELLGAIALSTLFIADGEPVASGVWRGTFTAISAYCNAGFALQSDSLVSYATRPAIVGTISALIIVGGLGPAVVVAVPAWLRGRPTTLLVRVVLVTSAWLLLVPAVLFLLVEWNHALAELPPVDRVVNAWFLSVTTRTAGFNSVDMTALTPATVTMVILLMAVGGSPGSTAGGLKTTTAAVLLLASVATARGKATLEIGRRTIPEATLRRALAATGALVMVVACTLVFLQLTQALSPTEVVFEVVSAVSTVGLSLGATGQLDEVGRVAITVLMLVGRVGPLTFLGVLMPVAASGPARRPPEDLPVG